MCHTQMRQETVELLLYYHIPDKWCGGLGTPYILSILPYSQASTLPGVWRPDSKTVHCIHDYMHVGNIGKQWDTPEGTLPTERDLVVDQSHSPHSQVHSLDINSISNYIYTLARVLYPSRACFTNVHAQHQTGIAPQSTPRYTGKIGRQIDWLVGSNLQSIPGFIQIIFLGAVGDVGWMQMVHA